MPFCHAFSPCVVVMRCCHALLPCIFAMRFRHAFSPCVFAMHFHHVFLICVFATRFCNAFSPCVFAIPFHQPVPSKNALSLKDRLHWRCLLSKPLATATLNCTCLGHLGRCNTDRIVSIYCMLLSSALSL